MAALLGACDASRTEVRRYEDEGTVCVADNPPQPGAAHLNLWVAFNECASFCAKVRDAECSATVDGGVITVTGAATTVQELDPDGDCPTACQLVDAFCRTERVDPGTYVLRYGQDERAIEVPGAGPAECPAHTDIPSEAVP